MYDIMLIQSGYDEAFVGEFFKVVEIKSLAPLLIEHCGLGDSHQGLWIQLAY
jgi:hypothetical protein